MLKKNKLSYKYNSSSNKILLDLKKHIEDNDITHSEAIDMLIRVLEETQTNEFISAETLETLGKKEGFECFQDKYENGVTLSLGGKIIVIDIDIEKFPVYWKVARVTTTWADSLGGQYFSPSTDAILLSNFSESYYLHSFESNFRRLTSLDRLSSPPKWDLFSTIRSLYSSLKQIYDYEFKIYSDSEKILCEKSGKPEFDAANIVGLSIWYWKQRRYCSIKEKLWRVIIEVEEKDPKDSSFSPLNIEWMNQKINLSNDGYEWIIPSSNFPSSYQFVMILDPPVVICLEDIKKISEIIGLLDNSTFLESFKGDDDLVYETILTSQSLPIHTKRTIHLPSLIQHQVYTIEKSTLFPAHLVERIPLYHPEQIHSILKILRKYTILQTLIESYINDDTCKNFLLYNDNCKTNTKDDVNINIVTFYEETPGIEISSSILHYDLKIKLSIVENGYISLKDIYTNKKIENIKSKIEHVFQISEDVGISCEYIKQMLEKEEYNENSINYYCDYCDVFLTHDSASVRKAHNAGKNHITNVREYYQEISHEKAQNVIDSIAKAYENQPVMLPVPGMFPHPIISGMPPPPIPNIPGGLPPRPGIHDAPLPPPVPGMPFPPPFGALPRLNFPFPGGFVPLHTPPPGMSQVQPNQQPPSFAPQNIPHPAPPV
ncbi:hypothetical protein PORY_002141 [Pneumocystis oryctolagi]|uniref:Uncharacterized protein n=1 Tax=Pneumocystis oryctolagi TaxID=42067 RepID=A0ACB7CA16_9ASCO|nr:hypothetical protein PORY_002141 [Pneumocystis oryctolagi]